ncbi:MAG: hypothetical protein Q9218_007217, partial [Villophora microphyllina]
MLAPENEFFRSHEPQDYRQKLLGIDFDDDKSIKSFRELNAKVALPPIRLGKLKDTFLMLVPDTRVLLGELQTDEAPFDTRSDQPESILGLYEDTASSRIGVPYYGSNSTRHLCPRLKPGETAPLEIFLQLGEIQYTKPMIDNTKHFSSDDNEWQKSNYVLVQNLADMSLWVLWKKFMHDAGTGDFEPAQFAWGRSNCWDAYAEFPGTKATEIGVVIYAKIADHWDQFGQEK